MFSSMRLRAFLMAFTSAFLCFIVFWMAVLLLNPPPFPPPAAGGGAFGAAGRLALSAHQSDCMTLLLCEEVEHPSLFFPAAL